MKKEVLNPKTVFNSIKYGFSQGILYEGGKKVVLSGQVGVDSDEKTISNDLFLQMDLAIDNIEKILESVEGNLTNVIVLRIYILDSEKDNQAAISKCLLNRFPVDPPVTSWIFVSGLSLPEWLIEIEAEAILP